MSAQERGKRIHNEIDQHARDLQTVWLQQRGWREGKDKLWRNGAYGGSWSIEHAIEQEKDRPVLLTNRPGVTAMGIGQFPPARDDEFVTLNLEPLTRRGRYEMRRAALGEWIAWRVLCRLAPRFMFVVKDEAIDRYNDQEPTLRRCWKPWQR